VATALLVAGSSLAFLDSLAHYVCIHQLVLMHRSKHQASRIIVSGLITACFN